MLRQSSLSSPEENLNFIHHMPSDDSYPDVPYNTKVLRQDSCLAIRSLQIAVPFSNRIPFVL